MELKYFQRRCKFYSSNVSVNISSRITNLHQRFLVIGGPEREIIKTTSVTKILKKNMRIMTRYAGDMINISAVAVKLAMALFQYFLVICCFMLVFGI